MQRILVTLAAATALLVAPATAQTYEQNTDPNAQELQTRTNPDARSAAPGSGLTIVGTVESIDDQHLALKATTGIEHIQIITDTNMPVTVEVGEKIAVDYTRTSQGVMIAQEIRPFSGETAVATTTATVPAPGESRLNQKIDDTLDAIDEAADEGMAELSDEADDLGETLGEAADDVGAALSGDADLDVDVGTELDELPATGSSLPLVGLGALLTLGAAGAIRFFVS